jgi:hypothetical protein
VCICHPSMRRSIIPRPSFRPEHNGRDSDGGRRDRWMERDPGSVRIQVDQPQFLRAGPGGPSTYVAYLVTCRLYTDVECDGILYRITPPLIPAPYVGTCKKQFRSGRQFISDNKCYCICFDLFCSAADRKWCCVLSCPFAAGMNLPRDAFFHFVLHNIDIIYIGSKNKNV